MSRPRRRHLRGSSLLLAGRVLSKFVNFAVQVAIVRLLSKEDFGAFAFGLGLIMAGELIVKLGLGRGTNRFVPLHVERGEPAQVMGALGLASLVIVVAGAIGWLMLWQLVASGMQMFPAGRGGQVVLLLALLAPVQALDSLCIQTLACFSRPREILVRKHLLGPALRAAAVAVTALAGGGSALLAAGYVLGGVLGLLLSLHLTWRELHQHGILPLPSRDWRVPSGLVRYSIPLISADLVTVSITAISTLFLMTAGGEVAVASMRAVVPAAALNMLVVQSFVLLFTPAAVRLFAAGRHAELAEHHWQSVAWVAVLSFPLFALTFAVAPGIVPLLLGQAYAESAHLLAILACGHYAVVCLAFNAESLQVAARTRAIVIVNALIVATGFGLAALLVPRMGVTGAALAVAGAYVGGALARHVALLHSGVAGRPPAAMYRVWGWIALASALAALVGWWWQPALPVQLALLALIALALLRATARSLDVHTAFPELVRLPVLGRLVVP